MNLKQLVNKAKDKSNFVDLKAYIAFCDEYLNYISDNLQATNRFSKRKSLSLLSIQEGRQLSNHKTNKFKLDV